jgi:hypothetical protein
VEFSSISSGGDVIALLLALSVSATPNDRTVYLVRPLYPGQELLAQRTETAIGQLFQKDARERQVIGRAELARFLAGKQGLDLSCAFGETACSDATDAAIRSLGIDWILLIKGGQEESAYRYVVTAYNPSTGEVQRAESAEPVLEKAALGALVKVVPLASAVEVTCETAKATVTIDGEKVGETPYKGQMLPGEHALKLESPGYIALTETLTVPALGQLSIKRALAGSPGKLIVHADPKEAVISIDGTSLGNGSVERAVSPGAHQLLVALDGYHSYEATVTVKAEEPLTTDVTLEPTTGLKVSKSLEEQKANIENRHRILGLDFEYAQFGSFLPISHLRDSPPVDTTGNLLGVSGQFAYEGTHFGILVLQPALLFNSGQVTLFEGEPASMLAVELRAFQPNLRFQIWRFSIIAQLGFEGRYLSASNSGSSSTQIDLDASGQLTLRGYLWQGLYLEASLRQTFYLVSLYTQAKSVYAADYSPWWGFNVGLGYAL